MVAAVLPSQKYWRMILWKKALPAFAFSASSGDENIFWERLWGTGMFNHLFLHKINVENLTYSDSGGSKMKDSSCPSGLSTLMLWLVSSQGENSLQWVLIFFQSGNVLLSMRKSLSTKKHVTIPGSNYITRVPNLAENGSTWVMCSWLQILISRSLLSSIHICLLITSIWMSDRYFKFYMFRDKLTIFLRNLFLLLLCPLYH